MHDFNSVSGMWSKTWLKGRGGRREGEGTKEAAFLHIPSCPRVLGWTRASGEGRKVEERRGDGAEGRGGRVAFVCFPRFKASLEK